MSPAAILLVDCGVSKSREPFDYVYEKSLGTLYCHGYLSKNGVKAHLVFPDDIKAALPFVADKVEKFIRSAVQERPEFIGFSCTSDTLPIALFLAEEIKKKQRSPQSKMILGGIGPTSYPELVLQHYPFIDAVVEGEGEQTLLELLTQGVQVKSWETVAGITYRDENRVICRNDHRTRITDLDEVPIQYTQFHYRIPETGEQIKTYSMVTSRGCTGHCLFCSHSLIWQRKITSHSCENIVHTAEKITRQNPQTHIAFQDDDFLFSLERLKRFSRLLKKSSHPIKWDVFGRLDRMTPGLLALLRDSGCFSITFGFDSVVNEGRSALGKTLTFKEALAKLKLAKKFIPYIYVNLIYGWAGETKKYFDQFLEEAYALKKEGFTIKIAPLTIYPGTPIHRQYTRKWDLPPNEKFFRPLLGRAYKYVKGHEELYPHLCTNSFDKYFHHKKELLQMLNETFIVYGEI